MVRREHRECPHLPQWRDGTAFAAPPALAHNRAGTGRDFGESGGPWLTGDRLTLADIAIAPFFFRLLALGRDDMWAPAARPRVSDWYAGISERASFRTAVNWPDETGGGYEEVGLSTAR